MKDSLVTSVSAKLPVNYERAKEALAACLHLDECVEWRNKAEAIASYAKQADDETLFNHATRIKARAIRRGGELLRAIEPAKNQHDAKVNGRASGGVPTSRAQAAKAAGLSKDQKHQMLRVAALPLADFEAAVESDEPPTVTELAKRGTKPSTAHLDGRDPGDFKASTHAQAVLRDLAAIATEVPAAKAVRGALNHEYPKMRANTQKVVGWIAALQSELEKIRC